MNEPEKSVVKVIVFVFSVIVGVHILGALKHEWDMHQCLSTLESYDVCHKVVYE